MNCKVFNMNLEQFIENDISVNNENQMKEHMKSCQQCFIIYNEKLHKREAFLQVFNNPNIKKISFNNEINSKLDRTYYKGSFSSKLALYIKRHRFKYAALAASIGIFMFLLPAIRNYNLHIPSGISGMAERKGASGENSAAPNQNINEVTGVNKEINTITVTDIQSRRFQGKLMTVKDPTRIAVGFSLKGVTADKTTGQLAEEAKAVAAINAGAFKLENPPSGSRQLPYGIIIKDGKIVYNDAKDNDSIQNIAGFNDSGILIAGRYSMNQLTEKKIKQAVSTIAPALIVDGKANTEINESGGINPRTAIGQRKDGTVIFLVIDGRTESSIGASVKEVIDIMLENDVWNAALLDGGASSTMYYNGKVINHPCNLGEKERIIPSTFLVLP